MVNRDRQKKLLIALGGNALVKKNQAGTVKEQFETLRTPMRQIARLSREYRIIITHGNGPQVGNLMIQQESCNTVPELPLEILVAQTQGQIGYMIESTLDSELMKLGIVTQSFIVSLISYVVVKESDLAFSHPSKPIGPVYSPEKANTLPFPTTKTEKGYRRVVASPKPITIVERREINKLIEMGFIVICCGGGGIPVVREGRAFQGVDAVIDKDLASGKLAEEVKADIFLIATDVKGVALNFGKPDQRYLREMSVASAMEYLENNQFPDGSMAPKVEAAAKFVKNRGGKAVICSIEEIERAVSGEAGTEIV